MKHDARTINDVGVDTLSNLINAYIDNGGEITAQVLALQMRIDATRGEFKSLAGYAEQFNCSVWKIRTLAADENVPHEFRTKKRDSSENSHNSRTNSAQGRTKNGDSEKKSKKLHTASENGRTEFADFTSNSKKSRTKTAPPTTTTTSIGGEYAPTLKTVLLECAAHGYDEEIGRKFHRYYDTRYWRLKDGPRLPDWNWRIQLRSWVERETKSAPTQPITSADNEQQTTAGPSKEGNATGHKPRSNARGQSVAPDILTKREEFYRKRFGGK
jgi:hypothetical protein